MLFIYPIILGILIGYILKGKLNNLANVNLNGIYYILAGFLIDACMQLLGRFNLLRIGSITYTIDIIMYLMISVFVFKNRKNLYAITIGFGSLLNAIAIFSNGGAMPIRKSALDEIIKNFVPSRAGLYEVMSNNTNFKSLSDIIYIKLLGPNIFSIGDIIIALAMMLIIITGMTKNVTVSNRIINRDKRQRRSKRMELS